MPAWPLFSLKTKSFHRLNVLPEIPNWSSFLGVITPQGRLWTKSAPFCTGICCFPGQRWLPGSDNLVTGLKTKTEAFLPYTLTLNAMWACASCIYLQILTANSGFGCMWAIPLSLGDALSDNCAVFPLFWTTDNISTIWTYYGCKNVLNLKILSLMHETARSQ